MARAPLALPLAAALLLATPAAASASFANRELGLGLWGVTLLPQGGATPLAVSSLAVEAGLYLDGGWTLYLQVPFSAGYQGLDPSWFFATGGRFGAQYLFLEESVRPYLTFGLAGLYLLRPQAPNFFAGPGAGFGVDLFVSESIALGARLTADLLLTVDAQSQLAARVSLGGGLYAHAYF